LVRKRDDRDSTLVYVPIDGRIRRVRWALSAGLGITEEPGFSIEVGIRRVELPRACHHIPVVVNARIGDAVTGSGCPTCDLVYLTGLELWSLTALVGTGVATGTYSLEQ
jgi:hypothetical protein